MIFRRHLSSTPQGHATLARRLVAAGADPSAVNCKGATPLHSAAGGIGAGVLESVAPPFGPGAVVANAAHCAAHAKAGTGTASGAGTTSSSGTGGGAASVGGGGGSGGVQQQQQSKGGRAACVGLLVAAGADPSAVDGGGSTALERCLGEARDPATEAALRIVSPPPRCAL